MIVLAIIGLFVLVWMIWDWETAVIVGALSILSVGLFLTYIFNPSYLWGIPALAVWYAVVSYMIR